MTKLLLPMSAPATAIVPDVVPTNTLRSHLVNSLHSEVGNDWYLQFGAERKLQCLSFEITDKHGHARRLDLAAVKEKVKSFRHAPPSEPYSVMLWSSDAPGMLLTF